MATVSELTSKNISAAQANVRNWGKLVYNVSEYGLKGDGVTDDTAALQSLIDLAVSEGRTTIAFSHGVYYVTSLVDDDKVFFVGDNASFTGGYGGHIEQLGDVGVTQTELDNLAGAGRTTETVKQNADDLAAHEANNATDVSPPHGMGTAAAQEYEEGSWTPSIIGATSYISQVGRYVRDGSVITCVFGLTLSDKTGVSGNVEIGGLPFTSRNVESQFRSGGSIAQYSNIVHPENRNAITIRVGNAANRINLLAVGSDITGALLQDSSIKNNTQIMGTVTYII